MEEYSRMIQVKRRRPFRNKSVWLLANLCLICFFCVVLLILGQINPLRWFLAAELTDIHRSWWDHSLWMCLSLVHQLNSRCLWRWEVNDLLNLIRHILKQISWVSKAHFSHWIIVSKDRDKNLTTIIHWELAVLAITDKWDVGNEIELTHLCEAIENSKKIKTHRILLFFCRPAVQLFFDTSHVISVEQ